jgi:two-component system sensor histidine kinase YesM
LVDINKLSFRSKLRSALLVISILSILITGFFSYTTTATIMENNALKLTQDTVVKSAEIVDEKLNKLMLVMLTTMISNSFQNMLRDAAVGNEGKYYSHMTNMDNVFSQARIAEPLIQSIYITTPIGEYYPLSLNRNRGVSFFDTPLYQRIQEERRNLWVEGHEDTLFLGKQRVVSLILLPISEYPLKDVYLVVNIREDGLRKLVSSQTESGSFRFLMNNEAQLVSAESNSLIKQAASSELVARVIKDAATGYSTHKLNEDTYLLNYARLGINDWTIIAIQSKDNVLKDMIYVKWMILFITVMSFVVTLLVSGAFTRYLLKPLQGLQLVMKRVEGNDLSARFESRNEDELAQVGYRFNRMLDQIVLLIDEVKSAEASKRTTEIKALSAQMDPHFLYNTLNTIYWKLNLKRVEESQKMVMSLSRLFQLGLNKGNEITTLDKEIQHVRQYLELQAYCYENLFQYEIQVHQDWLLELPVPRIILQPLVENSILHGFDSMETGGVIKIEIDGDQALELWTITVTDNGQGMDQATIRSLYHDDSDQGYAIGNLMSRMLLCYGELAQLNIESVMDNGTTVTLSIPTTGGNQDD